MSEEEPSPEEKVAMAKAAADAALAAAELTRAQTNNIRAQTERAREERADTENRKRIGSLVQAARTKVHLIPMALIFVSAVIALVWLLFRHA